jgi:hypothetical protein
MKGIRGSAEAISEWVGGGDAGCRVTASAQDLPWATVSHSELAAM